MSFILVGVLYLFIFADIYGKRSKDRIDKQNAITITFTDEKTEKGILIGKTNQILFLKQGEKVIAIPYASVVKEIEIQ